MPFNPLTQSKNRDVLAGIRYPGIVSQAPTHNSTPDSTFSGALQNESKALFESAIKLVKEDFATLTKQWKPGWIKARITFFDVVLQ